MTTGPAPMCMSCKRLSDAGLTCEAFPDGIPDAILFSEHDHREPFKGDHGLLYERRPGMPSLMYPEEIFRARKRTPG